MTASPVRGRVVTAWMLLLLSAAWLAPLAFADPPTPKPADAKPVPPEVQLAIFENTNALLAFLALKGAPAIAGLVLLILEWIRLRDIRRGLLPPFPPPPEATPLAGVLGGVAAVFAFLAIPMLVGAAVAQVAPHLVAHVPGRIAAHALGGIPIAIFAVARKRRLVAQGLSRPAPVGTALRDAGRTYCVSTAAGIALMLTAGLILTRYGIKPKSQEAVNLLAFSPDPLDPWSISLYAVLLAPWVEECVFRGFLQPALRARLGVAAGVWITSIVFTGLHFEAANGIANVYTLAPLFVLAVFLARLRDRTDSLLATTALHMLNNATSVVPALMLRT